MLLICKLKPRYRRDGARAWHAPSTPEDDAKLEEGDYGADVESGDEETGFPREGRMRGSYSPVSSYDTRSVRSLLFACPPSSFLLQPQVSKRAFALLNLYPSDQNVDIDLTLT